MTTTNATNGHPPTKPPEAPEPRSDVETYRLFVEVSTPDGTREVWEPDDEMMGGLGWMRVEAASDIVAAFAKVGEEQMVAMAQGMAGAIGAARHPPGHCQACGTAFPDVPCPDKRPGCLVNHWGPCPKCAPEPVRLTGAERGEERLRGIPTATGVVIRTLTDEETAKLSADPEGYVPETSEKVGEKALKPSEWIEQYIEQRVGFTNLRDTAQRAHEVAAACVQYLDEQWRERGGR
jgi:hypothetical protein